MQSDDIYKEVLPSAVSPTRSNTSPELEQSIEDIYTFFDRMHPSSALKLREGSSMTVTSKYTITDYITDMCTIVHLYLTKYNSRLSTDDKVFFKEYIETLRNFCKMMRKFDFNVAEPDFFAYTIGYNLKIITEYYGTSKHRQSKEKESTS